MAATSSGKCELCGKNFGKSAMTRHVKECGVSRISPGRDEAYHVIVDGRNQRDYWLHLSVPFKNTLGDLDAFLRKMWLECCGHLSSFEIAGLQYDSEGKKMRAPVRTVLEEGIKFSYVYDWGSSTELSLKVAGVRRLRDEKAGIALLARNNPPEVACGVCGANSAARVCGACAGEAEGWLCEACAGAHECGEEMLLPVVNSPRTGVCAYTGNS